MCLPRSVLHYLVPVHLKFLNNILRKISQYIEDFFLLLDIRFSVVLASFLAKLIHARWIKMSIRKELFSNLCLARSPRKLCDV